MNLDGLDSEVKRLVLSGVPLHKALAMAGVKGPDSDKGSEPTSSKSKYVDKDA